MFKVGDKVKTKDGSKGEIKGLYAWILDEEHCICNLRKLEEISLDNSLTSAREMENAKT